MKCDLAGEPFTKEQVYKELEAAELRWALFTAQEEIAQLDVQNAGVDAPARPSMPCKPKRRPALAVLKLAGQAAAAVLLVFYLGLTVAVAAVPSVRAQLSQLLISYGSKAARVTFTQNPDAVQGPQIPFPQTQDAVQVPQGWTGTYYPSWLPEGYADVQMFCIDGYKTIQLTNADGKRISFDENDSSVVTYLNTENAKTYDTDVNGTSAFVSEMGTCTSIAWNEFDCYLTVTYDGDAQTALQIARSVVRVK